MPELPEVESVRLGLMRARITAPLHSIWRSDKPLRIGAAWRDENLELLQGASPGDVARRGKYLLWQFTREGQTLGLVVHLGMTGRLEVLAGEAEPVPHQHVVLRFGDGRAVRFVDPRRFGGVRAGAWEALLASEPLCELGPEPLEPDFCGEMLQRAAGRSIRPLRDVLLDQRVVAGVGNIYAVEALFEAGLHPLLPAKRLHASAWERLASTIRAVLLRSVENGGTTFRDYRDAEGRVGRNQHALWVYGRAGQPCRRCGAVLEGFTVGGRSGAFCPAEQARPRSRIVR